MELSQAFALALLVSLASFVRGWTSDLELMGFATEEELEAALTATASDSLKGTLALTQTSVHPAVSTAVPHMPLASANSTNLPQNGASETAFNFLVVAADGSGDHRTVQAGIDAAPVGALGKRTTILIKAGDYFEKVVVPSSKTFLSIVGEDGARIFFNKRVADFGINASTAQSASFSVFADDFIATNVTFENTFGFPNGTVGSQAVALLAAADRAAFYNCTFLGHQDTLFALKGRQYYRNCTIVGSVDFIFGNARAIFDGCALRVISNEQNPFTAVAAHFRQSLEENTGFVFLGGSLVGPHHRNKLETYKIVLSSLISAAIVILANLKGPLVYTTSVWLGRLWGPYCTIVYANMRMENFIQPGGWTIMGNGTYTNTALVYGVNNWGPGSSTASWVPWAKTTLNSTEVAQYLGLHYIDGPSWLEA